MDERAKERAVRQRLAEFISEGERLRSEISDDGKMQFPKGPYGIALGPTFSERDWSGEAGAWADTAEKFLEQQVGYEFVLRFRSTTGLHPRYSNKDGLFLGTQQIQWCNTLSYWVDRLHEFIRELPR